jgi:Flp pilus assembly protein TadG
MVELALSLIVLTLLGAGAFQFGYAFWARQQIQSAIASGARFASRLDYQGRSAECLKRAFEPARNFVVYGDPRPSRSSEPLIPGLHPSHIAVDFARDTQGMPLSVTLSMRGFELDAVFSRYRLNGSPSATLPFQGRYSPKGCPQ